MKKYVILFALLIPVLIVTDFVVINHINDYVFERYEKEVLLTEDIVFDDELTVTLFGRPIMLNKGMSGMIVDQVDHNGDDGGEKYMHVQFNLYDGRVFSSLIETTKDVDDSLEKTIKIDQIESGETIVSEYKETRNRYYEKIKRNNTIGIVIVIVGTVVMCLTIGVMWMSSTIRHHERLYKKQKPG